MAHNREVGTDACWRIDAPDGRCRRGDETVVRDPLQADRARSDENRTTATDADELAAAFDEVSSALLAVPDIKRVSDHAVNVAARTGTLSTTTTSSTTMPPNTTDDASTDTEVTARDPTTLAFMCVRNAGRSQMATAFAERERAERGLEDAVEIVTGGTDPADAVHDVVVEALAEVDLDVNGRTPRHISEAALAESDFVATMGCSTLDLPGVDTDDWALDDPGERPLAEVRAIRDEIERRVVAVFDERFGER